MSAKHQLFLATASAYPRPDLAVTRTRQQTARVHGQSMSSVNPRAQPHP